MGPVSNVFEGWGRYLWKNATDEEKRRRDICKKCPLAIKGSYEKLMPDFSLIEVKGRKCKACGCPLSTKIRSPKEKCDLGKWEHTS